MLIKMHDEIEEAIMDTRWQIRLLEREKVEERKPIDYINYPIDHTPYTMPFTPKMTNEERYRTSEILAELYKNKVTPLPFDENFSYIRGNAGPEDPLSDAAAYQE